MKKILLPIFLISSSFANAAYKEATGTIEKMRVFSNSCTSFPGECQKIEGDAWIKISGLGSLGNCPSLAGTGLVFYIPEEDHFILSSAMNARSQNNVITIGVNDEERFHNGCKVDTLSF
ncbi:MAG: hypothetical protein ACFHVJ_11295 [Aestuariibacter sp.]